MPANAVVLATMFFSCMQHHQMLSFYAHAVAAVLLFWGSCCAMSSHGTICAFWC